jgi:NAD(P)-dependent dehydrogenase (short-subunit alcohol dehydrogenase family)
MRLDGKVAIVTGGASNLGAEVSRLLAAEGAKVVVADVLDSEGAAVVSDIQSRDRIATFDRTDITKKDDWSGLVERTVGAFQRIDVLVNSAGVHGGVAADLSDESGWDYIMAVNTKSQFLGIAAVEGSMRTAGAGSIVNFSSVGGLRGGAHTHPAYPASKIAVLGLTRASALRLGPDGIRVNAVVPGMMPLMRSARTDGLADSLDVMAARLPLRRIGTPQDISHAVLFLASDESSYITGAELVIDGGMMCLL